LNTVTEKEKEVGGYRLKILQHMGVPGGIVLNESPVRKFVVEKGGPKERKNQKKK